MKERAFSLEKNAALLTEVIVVDLIREVVQEMQTHPIFLSDIEKRMRFFIL